MSKVIDEKLGPLLQLLQIQWEGLDRHTKCITDTESKISALEDTMDPVTSTLRVLENRFMA